MTRPAKTFVFFNNADETFTGTINELMETYGEMSRPNLYCPGGATNDEGEQWRIGVPPVVTKVRMNAEQQYLFNIYEQGAKEYYRTGDTGMPQDINELRAIINSWKRNTHILSYQSKGGNNTIGGKEMPKRTKEELMGPYECL